MNTVGDRQNRLARWLERGVGSDRERRKAACDERNSGKAELRVVVVKFGSNLNFALFVTHVTRSRPSYLTTMDCLDTPSKAHREGGCPALKAACAPQEVIYVDGGVLVF